MRILGISAFYHDSAAALIVDGVIVAAVQQERFSRIKHDSAFPAEAIEYCLKTAGCKLSDLDQILFFEKPFLKFERLLETYVRFAPRGFASFRKAIPVWIKQKLFQKTELKKALQALQPDQEFNTPVFFSEHHLSHAASAFYPSPFERALVLTMDGVGEWATTTAAIGDGSDLKIFKEIAFPHSLGLLYSAVTYYCGFKVNSGEYKLMGLAPYGEPVYADLMREHLIDIKPDGSFRLNQKYFNYCTGLTMTSKHFDRLFGGPVRSPESELSQRHMDLAASVQQVVEEAILNMARSLQTETGERNLCLAGGVALNCVANGKLQRSGLFDQIWVQPAAGDAGGALGAALYAYFAYSKQPRKIVQPDAMQGAYLGSEYSDEQLVSVLEQLGAKFQLLSEAEQIKRCAQDIAGGKAVGWFQGRMEFGPRALGNRSILGDPRSAQTQSVLNLKIKFRESFRPFAPSVLAEKANEWFQLEQTSPYMLMVQDVHQDKQLNLSVNENCTAGLERLKTVRSSIPAVTHVDCSARIQTVEEQTNQKYHRLIRAFEGLTGCPLLVNTSFNIRGEPIVCTPEDAFRCFMGTEMDTLAIGNVYLCKAEQDSSLKMDYRNSFELD